MLTSLLLAAETAKLGAAIGAGIAAVGAGLGIGRIGGQAMDAMARQPEKIGELRSAMIIAAALVRGLPSSLQLSLSSVYSKLLRELLNKLVRKVI